jgi:hypothetical protein
MQRYSERRAWVRKHKLLRVHVADPADALGELYAGWITDRSAGGVCLSVSRLEVEEGTLLQVQPASAGTDLPWVEVRVKHCRRKPNRVELGCEFVQRHGWERTLLLA